MTRYAKRRGHTFPHLSSAAIGVLAISLVMVAFVLVYQKDRIRTTLSTGDTIDARFATSPDLIPNVSDVKIADVTVGTVTSLDGRDDGTTVVSMKLDDGITDRLGSDPTARVRANLVLGGRHFLELVPADDGEFDGEIPVSDTANQEELGDVLRALGPDARAGMQTGVRQLDKTLANGGEGALRRVVRDAPGVAGPATGVFRGLQGNRPTQDLQQLVPDLRSLAAELASDRHRLDGIVDGLGGTTRSLSRSRAPLAEAINDLPQTLPDGRAALDGVTGILHKLEETAASARPTVRELGPLLDQTDAALDDLAPVVRDLRPLLTEADPLAQDLVPTSQLARGTLGQLRGDVIGRIRGPVLDTVLDSWQGTGQYAGNGTQNPLYQEVGYLAARAANQSRYIDKNGTFLALALGAGASSFGGTDVGLVSLLDALGVPRFEIDPMGSAQPGSSASNPLQPPSDRTATSTATGSGRNATSHGRATTADRDPLADALGMLMSGDDQ